MGEDFLRSIVVMKIPKHGADCMSIKGEVFADCTYRVAGVSARVK